MTRRSIILQNMEHFASFIVCTLLLLNVYGTEGSLTSQQQCSLRSVCTLLDNVSNRQDRLEKKVKEHSAILGGRCNEGKVFSGLYFIPKIFFLLHVLSSTPDHNKVKKIQF